MGLRVTDNTIRVGGYSRLRVSPTQIINQLVGDSGAGNVVLSTIGVSGTIIGFHKGLGIGSIDKPVTITGIPLYGFYWDKPATDGKFYIKFGANGDVQIPGLNEIHLMTVTGAPLSGNAVAVWSDADKAYVITNLPMAQHLNQEYTDGNIPPFSFHMNVLPDEFIRYTYARLLRRV